MSRQAWWANVATIKSLPHTFLSVKVEDFDRIPEAIQLKAQELIDAEIASKLQSIATLNEDIGKLNTKAEALLELKNKLKSES